MSAPTVVRDVFDEAPAIIHSAREQWLMQRRELITASDVAAILRLHPSRWPADVFLDKLGQGDEASGWPLFYGTAFQDGVGAAYAHLTGREVEMESLDVPEIVTHPDLPWLGATLDGRILKCSDRRPAPAEGRAAPLEVKISSVGHTWSDDELPTHFQIQSTVQQACSGSAWGAIAAFVSLRQAPREQDIVFDRELFELMVPKLEEFRRCVQRKEPPLDDLSWFSTEAIKKLWSAHNGLEINLTEVDARIVEDWCAAKSAKAEAEAKVESLGNQIRLRMAGAALAYLPDGQHALALSNVKEGLVEAYKRTAHTRLLFKELKRGRK